MEEKAEGENTTFRIDDWVVFRSDADLAHLALQLRQKWSALFLRRLHSPGKPMTQVDTAVVDAIVNVLSTEEQALKLPQPNGIGQRPKPINSENLSSSPSSNDATPSNPPNPQPLYPRNSSGNFGGNAHSNPGGGGGRRGGGGGGGYRGGNGHYYGASRQSNYR